MKTVVRTLLAVLFVGTAVGQSHAAKLGDPAAALHIAKWVKGKPVDLTKAKGKNIVVVEFWATWCGPCRVSIPHLTEMQKKYEDKGVLIVSVTDEAAGTVEPFVKKQGADMEYAVAIDDEYKTSAGYMQAFGIGGIPHAFIVDKNGVLAWQGHPMDRMDLVLEEMVKGTYDLEAAIEADKTRQASAKALRLAQEYFEVIQSDGDPKLAAKRGDRFVTEVSKNPKHLNDFAWAILTAEGLRRRDRKLALRAAKQAYDVTEGKNADITDTYARALFDTGKTDEAIKLQKHAIKVSTLDREREMLERTLARYEKKAAETP